MKIDLNTIVSTLGRSEDDVFLLMHLLLDHMINLNPEGCVMEELDNAKEYQVYPTRYTATDCFEIWFKLIKQTVFFKCVNYYCL